MTKSSITGQASEPTPAQLKELFAQIESGRVTKERLQQFLRGERLEFPSYAVLANYDLTVEQLVKIEKTLSTEVIIANMIAFNLRRPNIKQGLSLGIHYPDLQREWGPIAILCEPWCNPYGGARVPCLYGGGSYRDLDLGWFEGAWDPRWRFAAVRK